MIEESQVPFDNIVPEHVPEAVSETPLFDAAPAPESIPKPAPAGNSIRVVSDADLRAAGGFDSNPVPVVPSPSRTSKPPKLTRSVFPAECSLGVAVRAAREARGMSLDDVAQQSKIGLEYLKALEGDRIHAVLPGVYVQAYLRSLSAFFRLDEAASDYMQSLGREKAPREDVEVPRKLLDDIESGAQVNEAEQKKIKKLFTIGIAGITIFLFALAWLIVALVSGSRPASPVSVPDPAQDFRDPTVMRPPADAPLFRFDESEFETLMSPQTPVVSVLMMSKRPGTVR